MQPTTAFSFLNETEAHYFNAFQERTAKELSGFFDSGIWSRTILQVCYEEGFALHAVIALGALDLTIDSVHHSLAREDHSSESKQHHEYALRQYNIALKFMRGASEKTTKGWVRNVLISCLLTSCVESYLGNQESALAQAQTGIDLLDLNHDTHCPISSDELAYSISGSSSIESDLVGMFARLEGFVVMFRDNKQIPQSTKRLRTAPSVAYKKMPSSFASLKEAKYCWDLLIARALRWRDTFLPDETANTTLDWGEDLLRARLFAGELTEMIAREMQLFDEKRLEWYSAFMPLFTTSRRSPGTNEFLAASVLKVQYLGSCITTELVRYQRESACDRYRSDFLAIVDLSRDVLQCLYKTAPARLPKAMFVFDSSLVVGLFLTATKCRERAIRRRAIGLLLAYPRREGFWDSTMAASVATWLMKTEEEGIPTGHIPEKARLRIVWTYLRLDERRAIVICSQLLEGTEQRVELPPVTISW